jgi:uncharacterized protein YaaR (DUF327 family)
MKILKILLFVICTLSSLQDILYAMESRVDPKIVNLDEEIDNKIVTLDEEVLRQEMVEIESFIPTNIENEIQKQLQNIQIPENHQIKITQEITSNNISSVFWPHGYDVDVKVQDNLVIHNIKL